MNKAFEKVEGDYKKKLWELQNNLITEEEFSNFCMRVLNELMIENKDVLERLKNI